MTTNGQAATPVAIVHAVSSIARAEAILFSKSLGMPPPTSSYGPSTSSDATAATTGTERIRISLYDIILSRIPGDLQNFGGLLFLQQIGGLDGEGPKETARFELGPCGRAVKKMAGFH
jgi:hypothetical protein